MHSAVLLWQERQSNSRFIQSVWTSSTPAPVSRAVIADPCISIALVKNSGDTYVVVTGPKTKPYHQLLPSGYTCVSIRLRPGTFLKNWPAQKLIDKSVTFAADAEGRFLFEGVHLQFPDFEQAERLVDQLYELGHIEYRLPGRALVTTRSSDRTYARHIRHATGLSPYRLYQLQRMHQALQLLKQGRAAADVAAELAFVDQSHFVRASRQFFGHTPRQLLDLPQSP